MSNIITIMADKIMAANRTLTEAAVGDIIHKTNPAEAAEMTREDLEIMADIAINSKYNIDENSDGENSNCNNIVIQSEEAR